MYFKSDAKVYGDAILNPQKDLSEFGQIALSCSYILSLRSNGTLSWIQKQANLTTHSFIRKTILYASPTFRRKSLRSLYHVLNYKVTQVFFS